MALDEPKTPFFDDLAQRANKHVSILMTMAVALVAVATTLVACARGGTPPQPVGTISNSNDQTTELTVTRKPRKTSEPALPPREVDVPPTIPVGETGTAPRDNPCEPGFGPVYEGGELSNCIPIESSPLPNAEPTPHQSKRPSPVAYTVQQKIEEVRKALESGSRDVSELSDDILHVKSDGDIELAFHAATAVGRSEEKDLEAFGATIVASTAVLTPSEGIQLPEDLGVIQAWIPYDQVYDAARLPWVVAITPPGYGDND